MSKQTSSIVISAYRATSIVDTPMRKIEVLEEQNGVVWLREISFDTFHRVSVRLLHLEHHESQSLAKTLLNLEPPADVDLIRGRTRIVPESVNGDGHVVSEIA